ncbi:hypothetical protein [Sulfurivermis fontis]|uniref:hypothetical protein n=1 Tax=Sulfurivermis fontis TaxID=1972068 RepID=UPI000FD84534|nr:hypothetical protein [Sulfurivermis fontis]
MATTDVDLPFDAQAKLHIAGSDVATEGLIRPRDLAQARGVADLAEHYLGLSFDDECLAVFPARIRALVRDLRPTT